MNFWVLEAGGRVSIRPDSSRNKDNGDYYVPTDIEKIDCSPVVYARMCRSGKAIGGEFASRYYDAVGFGLLLYPDGETVYDKTTLLPMPLYNPLTLEREDNRFIATLDGTQIINISTVGMTEALQRALVGCSVNSTLHKGDFTMVELQERRPLLRRQDKGGTLHAEFCENELLDINIKF